MITSFIIVAIVVFIDQLTKFLVYGTMAKSIIGDLLWFHSTLNTGVAFSMFQDKTIFFTIISILASFGFVYLIVSKRFFKYKAEKIILGFILGGTIGNLIDRIIFGGVRDFIYLKFINFAIFNIADMAVSLGAIAFCIFIILFELKEDKNNKKTANNDENNAENNEKLENNKEN